MSSKLNSKFGLLAVLAIAGSAGACKTVSPDDLNASLSSLRSEMQQEMAAGDEQVTQWADGRFGEMDQRFAALERDLQEMEREFEVSIARLEDELRFNVPVYFGFDESALGTDDQEILARFASVSQKYYPDALVTVEGFTDPSGDENYNLWLGEQRAKSVAEYLVSTTAMSEDDVKTVSYGEDTRRLVSQGWGPGSDGWENRRVVLVIDHDGTPPALVSDGAGSS